ncbi:DUF2334 domain-containing protein [Akkermansiaceae bacterium]|nr:DUF2334 domain-containing protein [Akkermansiaceae bacterium]
MKVSYRVDDVSHFMCEENFEKIEKLFKEYDIKPLIGVIPRNEDQKLMKFGRVGFDFWEKIRHLEEIGWTVAMHGMNHVYETYEPGILKYPKKSEFSGLSSRRQEAKLKEGLDIMKSEGLDPKIFMAPSHSFDNTTIELIEKMQFKYITDGLYFQNFCLKGSQIKFIPQVSSKIVSRAFVVQTVCLHPNLWDQSEFYRLEEEIIKHRTSIVDFSHLMMGKAATYYPILGSFILHLKTKGRLLIKSNE